MDIPDTEYWCMYRAALWIMTRSPSVRDVVLDRPAGNALLAEWQCRRWNALTWLEEHKRAMLPKYRDWYAEKALELAFDELAREIWFELACEEVREKCGGRFKSRSELRAAIENKRMYVHAQQLVANLLAPRGRGRPPKTSAERDKDALLVEAVEELCQTGLTKIQACEKLRPCSRSAAAQLRAYQRAKGPRR